MPNKCRFCGQEIPEGRQFCSMSCRNKAISQKIRDKTGYQTCLQCGKKFYRHPSEIAKGRVTYCSKPCMDAYLKEHGRPDKKVVSKVCKNCGKEFTIPHCWLKKTVNAGQFCSRECVHEYRRKNNSFFGIKTRGEGSGVFTDSHGYVHEYDPQRQKFVRQHRLVMERMLGRPLEKWESVHHKNGKRAENDPKNLELVIGNHFSGKRVRDVYARDLERLALENLKLKKELQRLRE
jgi:predicted nucleic acid-binding Zn ribbon protein